MAGLAKRAPIHYFDMDRYEFRENSTDCVISKEALFTVEDKDRLLKEIIRMIRPRGQLLLTDYVLSEKARSDAHPSELQSLMRISYAVFCLKKKKKHQMQ